MSVRKAAIVVVVVGGALVTGALFRHRAADRGPDSPTPLDSASTPAIEIARRSQPETTPGRALGEPDTFAPIVPTEEPTPGPGSANRADIGDRDLLAGKVKDEAGRPIENADISFAGRNGKEAMDALSDSHGEFRLRLAPGEYGAEATAPGYLPDRRSLKIDGGTQSVEFVLRAAGAIFGQVEGLSESDAALHVVWAVPVLSSVLVEDRAEQARVRADSTYEVAGLEEGAYQIYLDGDFPDNGEQVFLAAGDRVRADLRAPAGMIVGIVRLPIGSPLRTFLLHLSYAETGRQVELDVPLATAGRFTVKGLPPGQVLATASAEGIARSPHSALTLRPGSPARVNFDFVGSQVLGSVVDARTGQELAGASVSVVTLDPQRQRVESMSVVAMTTSDQSGSFAVSGLAAGEYALAARAPGHAISTVRFTSNGSDDVPLVVALEAGLEVQVVVLDAAGRLEAGAWVMIDRQPPIQGTSYSERTNNQGLATFSDFASGEFMITVLHGQSEESRTQGVRSSRTQRAVAISPASHRVVIHQEG